MLERKKNVLSEGLFDLRSAYSATVAERRTDGSACPDGWLDTVGMHTVVVPVLHDAEVTAIVDVTKVIPVEVVTAVMGEADGILEIEWSFPLESTVGRDEANEVRRECPLIWGTV